MQNFVATALDLNNEIFVLYVASLASSDIYPFYRSKIVFLISNKVPIAISAEYI